MMVPTKRPRTEESEDEGTQASDSSKEKETPTPSAAALSLLDSKGSAPVSPKSRLWDRIAKAMKEKDVGTEGSGEDDDNDSSTAREDKDSGSESRDKAERRARLEKLLYLFAAAEDMKSVKPGLRPSRGRRVSDAVSGTPKHEDSDSSDVKKSRDSEDENDVKETTSEKDKHSTASSEQEKVKKEDEDESKPSESSEPIKKSDEDTSSEEDEDSKKKEEDDEEETKKSPKVVPQDEDESDGNDSDDSDKSDPKKKEPSLARKRDYPSFPLSFLPQRRKRMSEKDNEEDDGPEEDEQTKKMKRMRYAISILTNPNAKETRKLVLESVREAEVKRSEQIYESLIAPVGEKSSLSHGRDGGQHSRKHMSYSHDSEDEHLSATQRGSPFLSPSGRRGNVPSDGEEDSGPSGGGGGRAHSLPGYSPSGQRKRGKLKKTFPEKLMYALSQKETSSAITWLPSGESFCIINPKILVSDVLPKFFKSAKFESFTRKLKRWGFKRISSGFEYRNEYFKRDDPELCLKMRAHNPPDQSSRDSGMGCGVGMSERDQMQLERQVHQQALSDATYSSIEKAQQLVECYRKMGGLSTGGFSSKSSLLSRSSLDAAASAASSSKMPHFDNPGLPLGGFMGLSDKKLPGSLSQLSSLNRGLFGKGPLLDRPQDLSLSRLKSLQDKLAVNMLAERQGSLGGLPNMQKQPHMSFPSRRLTPMFNSTVDTPSSMQGMNRRDSEKSSSSCGPRKPERGVGGLSDNEALMSFLKHGKLPSSGTSALGQSRNYLQRMKEQGSSDIESFMASLRENDRNNRGGKAA